MDTGSLHDCIWRHRPRKRDQRWSDWVEGLWPLEGAVLHRCHPLEVSGKQPRTLPQPRDETVHLTPRFVTTYLCKAEHSALVVTKTKLLARLNFRLAMKVALSQSSDRINSLVNQRAWWVISTQWDLILTHFWINIIPKLHQDLDLSQNTVIRSWQRNMV